MNFSNYYHLNKYYLSISILFNIIIVYITYEKKINQVNIPELNYYNSQTLKFLFQSKTCPLTLFLFSSIKKNNDSIPIKEINLKDKNYFITYFEDDGNYNQYYEILRKNGLIKSKYKYGKHNLFISKLFNDYFSGKNYDIYDLDKFQKVYRFYSSYYLFNKDIFYKFYAEMKTHFYEEFKYMPETYIYPEQKDVIFNKFKNYNLDLNNLWLVKPNDKCAGIGISLFNSLENIKFKEFVITKYITNLNLIKGKKYDLRLYALITGLKPLRIYFYNEGNVRIASEKYYLNKSFIGNKYIHLTNIDLNKNNKNYINPNNTNDYNSNMYNILMYEKYLKKLNIEYSDIKEKIKDLIIKSIISVYRNLTEENELLNVSDRSFYNLLGFDILITDKFEPILCEINYNPTMEIHNNFEKENKTNLFLDTLNLIGIVPYSKISNKPLKNEIKFKRDIDDSINNAFCELERPRGGYELIFPLKKNINKYKRYFIYNIEENKIFWSKILS